MMFRPSEVMILTVLSIQSVKLLAFRAEAPVVAIATVLIVLLACKICDLLACFFAAGCLFCCSFLRLLLFLPAGALVPG